MRIHQTSFTPPSSPSPATAPSPDAIPGETIVVFRDGVTRDEQARILAALAPRSVEDLPLVNGALVVTDPSLQSPLTALAAGDAGKIAYSQPNIRQHLRGGDGVAEVDDAASAARSQVGTDPDFARQYHLDNTGQTGGTTDADVNAPQAWASSRGKGVIVALADTNIDIEHPDIAPNVWTNADEVPGNGVDDDGNGYVDDVHGWNFGKNSNRPQDGRDTHGTHTAGIIAAAQGNGIGGSGVAPDVQLMPLAILTSNATTANAIKAFAYAVSNGANVISNSWGNNTYEPALAEAVRKTTDAGVSVVVAAGNENWDTGVNGSYPDNYAGSFSVAASTDRDAKASYSNRGTITIDVAAPGDKVWSTLPGGRFGAMSGTSMAAPVVSGVLALVKARYPQLSMREVEQRVLRSVRREGAAAVWNGLVASGGRVDAAAALMPLAAPGEPHATDGAVVGTPVRVDWSTDLLDGQRFQLQASSNADAVSAVSEDFESGAASRSFVTTGDRAWQISSATAKSGAKSFNVEGLKRDQQARLELTETILEPTELSFAYTAARGGELSFFVNRDLQFKPVAGDGWQDFRTTLQPGTYTFTWLATGKAGQSSPIAVDDLRIGQVSDARWTNVGASEPGSTGVFWTPDSVTGAAALRVRADNGRFQGDWVTSEPFPVVQKSGGQPTR